MNSLCADKDARLTIGRVLVDHFSIARWIGGKVSHIAIEYAEA